MTFPTHLTDPDAHKEMFAQALESVGLSGVISPFSGSFGGTGNKHPIERKTGEPNTAYALCDGGTYTAPDGAKVVTPDLRDRFIVGAGSSYAVSATGGSTTQSHTVTVASTAAGGTVGGTTLTTATMPNHPHGGVISDQTTTNGTYGAWRVKSQPLSQSGDSTTPEIQVYIPGSTGATGSGGSHAHPFTGTAHTHTATVAAADNRPPYYALAFIMKL